MKGIIKILLLALALLVLSACSSNAREIEASEPQVLIETTGDAVAPSPDIQAIIDRGILRVGIKNEIPKFGYLNPSTNELEGLEIDIARAIANKILGDPSKVDFQYVVGAQRTSLLENKELDIVIAVFTITEERKKAIAFSAPYYVDSLSLLTRKEGPMTTLADVDGMKIGVLKNTTAKEALKHEVDALGITINFVDYESHVKARDGVLANDIVAYSNDRAILNGFLTEELTILPESFSPQEYGIGMNLESEGLLELVNILLKDLKDKGEMDALLKKWDIR